MNERRIISYVLIHLLCIEGIASITTVRVRAVGHTYSIGGVVCIDITQVTWIIIVNHGSTRSISFTRWVNISSAKNRSGNVVTMVANTIAC